MKSLKELTQLYKNSRTPAVSLTKDDSILAGGRTRLESLTNLYEKRQNSLHPLKEPIEGNERGIAICVVIVDELYHEDVWRAWLETSNTSISSSSPYKYHAKLFIHAKYPERIQSEWVKKHTVPYTFLPDWNSPEVVRAMVSLLHEATASPQPSKQYHRMIFATESCIPCCTLGELGEVLMADDKSWLDAYNTPQTRYEAGYCFDAVDSTVIPRKAVWKALPGWVCLTRRHVLEVLALIHKLGGYEKGILYIPSQATVTAKISEDGSDLIDAFGSPGQWHEGKGGVHAPEEVFFATMLSLLGYLRSTGEDEVHRKRITYADWKKRSDANPIAYPALTAQLFAAIRASGALLGRKFPRGAVGVEAWRRVVGVVPEAHSKESLGEGKGEGEGNESKSAGEKRTRSELDTDDQQTHKKTST